MTSKTPVRFIYFDVGGVLLAFYHIRFDMPKEWGIDPNEYAEVLTAIEPDRATGKITDADAERILTAKFGDKIPKGYLASAQFVERFRPIKPMHDMVVQLSKKYRIGLLTNVSEQVWNRGHGDFAHIYPAVEFDQIVASYREKVAKPDPEIYRRAIERTGLPANQICFVDDLQENLDVAAQLGMVTVLSVPDDIAITVNQLQEMFLD